MEENPRGWRRGRRKDKRLQALKMHKKPRNHAAFGWERLPRSTALQTQAGLLCLQTRLSEPQPCFSCSSWVMWLASLYRTETPEADAHKKLKHAAVAQAALT